MATTNDLTDDEIFDVVDMMFGCHIPETVLPIQKEYEMISESHKRIRQPPTENRYNLCFPQLQLADLLYYKSKELVAKPKTTDKEDLIDDTPLT